MFTDSNITEWNKWGKRRWEFNSFTSSVPRLASWLRLLLLRLFLAAGFSCFSFTSTAKCRRFSHLICACATKQNASCSLNIKSWYADAGAYPWTVRRSVSGLGWLTASLLLCRPAAVKVTELQDGWSLGTVSSYFGVFRATFLEARPCTAADGKWIRCACVCVCVFSKSTSHLHLFVVQQDSAAKKYKNEDVYRHELLHYFH